MPQMMPMKWLMLTSILIMMLNNLKPQMMNPNNKIKENKKTKKIWKW